MKKLWIIFSVCILITAALMAYAYAVTPERAPESELQPIPITTTIEQMPPEAEPEPEQQPSRIIPMVMSGVILLILVISVILWRRYLKREYGWLEDEAREQ